MESSSFSRRNLLQERVSLKGNMSACLSLQYRPASVAFAEFTHQATKQRVFCVLINYTEVLIINNILDLSPKPFAVNENSSQANELTISRNDGKFCALLFETSQSFAVWQNLLSEALAEAICCDAMKTLKSGRLSAVRMNRCLNICKLLTQDAQLLTQVKRLRSIRFQINTTMLELQRKEGNLSSPDVRKVKVSCNFLRYVYPTVRCDPDLTFLTEQMSGGKCSAADLEQICMLLRHVEQEDRREFLRMVKLSAVSGDGSGIHMHSVDNSTNHSTSGSGNHSPVSPRQKEAPVAITTTSAAAAAVHRTPLKVKKVSWANTVLSNEKTRAGSRSRKASGRRSPSKMRGSGENSVSSVVTVSTTDAPVPVSVVAAEVGQYVGWSSAVLDILQCRQGHAQAHTSALAAPESVVCAPVLSLVPPGGVAPPLPASPTQVPPPAVQLQRGQVQATSQPSLSPVQAHVPTQVSAPAPPAPALPPLSVPQTSNTSLYLMEQWCKDSASPMRSPLPSPLPSSSAAAAAATITQLQMHVSVPVQSGVTLAAPAVAGASPRSPTRSSRSPVQLSPPTTPTTSSTTTSDGYALVTNATPVLTVNGKALQSKGGGSGKRTVSTPAKDDNITILHPLHPLRVTWLAVVCSVGLVVICACVYTACFGAPLSLSYSSHTYGSNGYSTVTFSLSSSNAVVSTVRDDPADVHGYDLNSSTMPPAMYVPLPPPKPVADKALPAVKSRYRNTKGHGNKAQAGDPGTHVQTHKQQQGSSTHTKNAFTALSRVIFSPLRMLRNMIASVGNMIGRLLFRTARV